MRLVLTRAYEGPRKALKESFEAYALNPKPYTPKKTLPDPKPSRTKLLR